MRATAVSGFHGDRPRRAVNLSGNNRHLFFAQFTTIETSSLAFDIRQTSDAAIARDSNLSCTSCRQEICLHFAAIRVKSLPFLAVDDELINL